MAAPLDPVIAQIIPLLPLRDPTTMTPQSARDSLRALAAARAAVPPPPVDAVKDIKVKGGDGLLDARLYRVGTGAAPTVVFYHGGGWVAGDLETHDRQARWLAIETGAVVVSVDYRRPPETRFPGAFEDAFAAARDIFSRVAEFGGDARRLGVAGDSAGGNLAAATAIACRDAGIALAAQLLVYPVTDVLGNYAEPRENARYPSRAENAEGYFLSRAVMEWFSGHYLADPAHGGDWRVSPLRAASLAARLTLQTDAPAMAGDDPFAHEALVPDQPSSNAASLSILVAEDNEINALLMRSLLTRLGHSAVVTSNGEEALESWLASDSAGTPYDLVLMDIQMPKLDGIETTKRIRAREAGQRVRRTPILALTANALVEDRYACFEAGMDGFLIKPLDLDKLADALKGLATAKHVAA